MAQTQNLIIRILRFHKLKIFVTVFFVFVFLVILTPANDFIDLLSEKISDLTKDGPVKIYLSIADMHIKAVPAPAIEFEKFKVDFAQSSIPALASDRLTISPWIAGLLSFRQGAHLNFDGLFKGQLDFSFHEGEKLKTQDTKSNTRMQEIAIEAQDIALPALCDFLKGWIGFNYRLNGKTDLSTHLQIDPTFATQPKGPIELSLKDFGFQSLVIPLGGLTQTFPALSLKQILVKGQMESGRLTLSEVKLGSEKEALHGNITGDLLIAMRNRNGQTSPELTGYNLAIDLTMSENIHNALKFLDIVIGSYTKPSPKGTRYHFRIKASDMFSPPKMESL